MEHRQSRVRASLKELSEKDRLRRELGLWDAILLGLGSILGTGVFVSIALAAQVAGESALAAIILGGLLALFNALSSAQLAASHPVSGGTYEYGYRYLSASWGFCAGWMFLCAKSASAATAALGLSSYLLNLVAYEVAIWRTPLAFFIVLTLTAAVGAGLRRSTLLNSIIVSITLISLLALIVVSLGISENPKRIDLGSLWPESPDELFSLLQATALMFVAYTGYGRIATLGEEVEKPTQTIPRAILLTLSFIGLLYFLVALVSFINLGAEGLAETIYGGVAPLREVARATASPYLVGLISVGAVTALLGVILNLILGLSRVLLAMARRTDMPERFSVLDEQSNPRRAVWAVGALVALLTLIGSIKLAWSFSAVTVLLYYAVTNACCLRLPEEFRLYPRVFAYLGLLTCGFLAFWVEWEIWLTALVLLLPALALRHFKRKKYQNSIVE